MKKLISFTAAVLMSASLLAQAPKTVAIKGGKLLTVSHGTIENGTIVLSCSATAFSQPTVNLNSLKAQLTGRNPGNAQKIIQSNVEKVQGVTVSEWPFKLFYLPLRASQIDIVENFVATATKSP